MIVWKYPQPTLMFVSLLQEKRFPPREYASQGNDGGSNLKDLTRRSLEEDRDVNQSKRVCRFDCNTAALAASTANIDAVTGDSNRSAGAIAVRRRAAADD